MCIVCQNVPAVMTGLSGAGLVVRAAIRRTRAPRHDAPAPRTDAAITVQVVPTATAPR